MCIEQCYYWTNLNDKHNMLLIMDEPICVIIKAVIEDSTILRFRWKIEEMAKNDCTGRESNRNSIQLLTSLVAEYT